MLTPTADRLEHDANLAWREGPRRALAELGPLGQQAAAVGISAMVPSMTAVDADGRALTPGLLKLRVWFLGFGELGTVPS